MTTRNYEIMNMLGDRFFCENDTKFQNEIKKVCEFRQQSKKSPKHFAHDTDLSFSILNIKRIYYSAEQDTQQISAIFIFYTVSHYIYLCLKKFKRRGTRRQLPPRA